MEELDLKEIFNMFWAKIVHIILIVLIFMVIGILYSYLYVTPKYKSTTSLVLTTTADSNITSGGGITSTDVSLNNNLVANYTEIITSTTVVRQVIDNLGIDISEDTLKSKISVSSGKSTQMINVDVVDEDPHQAKIIANEVAKVFAKQIPEIYKMNNIYILDEAEEENVPYNINHIKDIAIFAFIGLVVASVYVLIANMLDKKSNSFLSIENVLKENAKLDHILVDFGGQNKISNYYTNLEGDFSENNLKTVYLGTENNLLDINYNIEVYGKNAKCNIEAEGAINGKSHKNFKGTIDFKKGCENSKGKENENCMILSDIAKSKSLPMLLCEEENVEGEHGVSSGKIDESKLFYIMAKGISDKDAKKLIVKANFSKIINEINDETLQSKILEIIDNNL